MLIYRFKPHERGDLRVALSSDQTGAALPSDGAPWRSIGQVDLDENSPWIKVPRHDIEAAIADRGYFIWSIAVTKAN